VRAKVNALREILSPCRRERKEAKVKRNTQIILVVLGILLVFGGFVLSPWLCEYLTNDSHSNCCVQLPTPTSYPRLEESEAQARVAELLETNGGCLFPCWWGIVPGTTTWEEVHAQLSPLMDHTVYHYRIYDGTVIFVGQYNPFSGTTIEITTKDHVPVPDIMSGDIPLEYLSNLRPSSIFQTYGMPAEIYVKPPQYVIKSCLGEFEMFLYYPANEFAARYRYRSYAIDQTIRVCELDQPSSAEFYMWEPSRYKDFHEAAYYADWHADEHTAKPIEDKTEWNVESFYAIFQSGAGSDLCITVPPFNWKQWPPWCEENSS
jgi:hypothetical protein